MLKYDNKEKELRDKSKNKVRVKELYKKR